MTEFPVVDVSGWRPFATEQLGSKKKAWRMDPDGRRWLLKYPLPNSGEHWSEALAAAIAGQLGIPHAEVMLATCDGELCSVTLDFRRASIATDDLVLGNTMLATIIAGYDLQARNQPHHTVEAVLDLLASRDIGPPLCESPPLGISTADTYFVGYLLLDALVGNTDRHHENWGVIVREWEDHVGASQAFFFGANYLDALVVETRELAPSFDHASSLGRNLLDEARITRLATLGKHGTVEHYCARGKSPFFAIGTERALTVREAFERAREQRPEAGDGWLSRVSETAEAELHAAVDRIPAAFASVPTLAFAKAVLTSNLAFLLSLRAKP